MKKVSDLLPCSIDIPITGITDDSREVKKGFLFVATKGFHVDHFDYIEDAINRGCSFIVCDREIKKDFPHFVVDNLLDTYIELCQKFYDVTPDDFSFIGVTGTDGKTTTTSIIQELIGDCAYLGTNGLKVFNKEYDTHNTTPCISELYHDFSIIKKNHCNNISMEVSSEALLYQRVQGIKYDIIGFTNITGDHLNIHKTFENYVECKLSLLNYLKEDGFVVLNGDDPILKKINHSNKVTFGFQKDNDYVITKVDYQKKETIIELEHQNTSISIKSPFFGQYNVYNVVEAFIIGKLFGIEESLLLSRIHKLSSIKGRCEFIDFGQNYDIVLDYAHTINGIKSILESFQNYENIIVVTGCAGGREKEKRPIIGDYIIHHSDVAIFTMDDPRYEDVDDIIDEMVVENKDYFRIVDREDAIYYALSIAYPGTVVLILGKGRDNYMAIKDKKIHYSDYEVLSNYFRED
jgi:UDP-N-acetylmuramoyl-L-alanyl-D-glutamate--2,6-diaminopimelate ligase